MIAVGEIDRINRILVEWVEAGLCKRGKTKQGLAEALQVGPWQITRMLEGSRRKLWAHELMAIAIYLNEAPPLHLILPAALADITQAEIEAHASRKSRARRTQQRPKARAR